MELRLHHIIHLYNVFRENDGKENCAQVLEEEVNKMFGIKSSNNEHDCNVFGMNSLNIHDANDMQSHKIGDAMFDEDDIFSPPSFNEKIYYDDSMPPIYDDYIYESGFGDVMTCAIIISILDIQRIHTNNIAIMLIIQIFCAKHFINFFF